MGRWREYLGMKDSQGRNIDYLRISVTDRCNLRCIYCMPETGVPMLGHDEILSLEEILEIAQLTDSVLDLRKIRVTGGEPLIRKGIVLLVRGLAEIAETVLTTNGLLLPEFAESLAEAGLSRVNISLDSLNDGVIARVTRRNVTLKQIEKAIHAAKRAGLEPVKVNCVVLKGINTGELSEMVKWAGDMGVVLRFIEHMPMEGSSCKYYSGDELLRVLLPHKFIGSEGTAQLYRTPEGNVFGLIAPVCTNMCSSCTRLRLTADGSLLPCLAGGKPLHLKEMLRSGSDHEEIKRKIEKLILEKPLKGRCGGVRMWRIGG